MRLRSIREAAPVHDGLVIAAIFVVALLPLLSTPLLPFIDLYNHLARYFVLAHLDQSPFLRQSYAANWSLLPNIGLDLLGTALLRFLPPERAAHVVVITIFAAQYLGVLVFNRVLTGRISLIAAVQVVPLLYSFILNWGFANFLFGLGLVFGAAAWWLGWRDRPWLGVPVAGLFAVAIFFCHGLDFMLYGILVAALEVGLWAQRPVRRLAELAAALVPVAVQAVVPILLFAAAATSRARDGLTNADASVDRLYHAGALGGRIWDLLCYRAVTVVRVAEGPSLAFDVIAFGITFGVVVTLIASGRVTIARLAWPALAAGVLLVVGTPPALFGVGYVADRMPLFLAMLFVGSLSGFEPADRIGRVALATLAGLTVVRLIAIAVGWQGYATDYQAFRGLAAHVPRHSLVIDVMVGGNPRMSDTRRCAMYRPLMVSLDDIAAPLFANETQQPLRLVGRLRRAVDAVPHGFARGSNSPGFYDDVIAAAGAAGFDYALVCEARNLTRPLPSGTQVISLTPRMILVRLRQSAPVPSVDMTG